MTSADGPGASRVTLSGDLDMSSAPELANALSGAAQGSATVILDLSELNFLDSTGLHAILVARAQLEAANCRLLLVPGCRQVQRVVEITGAAEYLEFLTAPEAVLATKL